MNYRHKQATAGIIEVRLHNGDRIRIDIGAHFQSREMIEAKCVTIYGPGRLEFRAAQDGTDDDEWTPWVWVQDDVT